MIKNKKSRNLINYLVVFFLLVSGPALANAPAAGTFIKNQATATYKDSSGIEQTTTSNLVKTLIQQVGAFTLDKSQSRYGVAGQSTSFTHILTNVGNGDDSFDLVATDNTGDSFDFGDINIYPDKNQDGIADSNTPINTTGILALGESFYFVVAADIPPSALDGETSTLTVMGTSNFDSSVVTNTDDVTVSDNAVLTVTKSMSSNSGEAGSGPYTVILTYSNYSNSDASNFTLVDQLPAGMTYVVNSVRWSKTGAGAVLTGTSNQVTAVLAQVVAGDTGTISFEVMLDSGINAQTLLNTGLFSYDDGIEVVVGQETNTVPLEVIPTPAVVANGSTASNVDGTSEPVTQTTASLGGTVAFDNIIWNLGNSTDTFDISIDQIGSTFPSGTTFSLFKSDGFTPLLDNDDSGIVDTGELGSGEYYTVVLKAKLPMTATVGNNNGAGFTVTKTAISAIDSSVTNSVTDRLNMITGSGVDVTNGAAIGGADVRGEGIGPESTSQTQLAIAPGESGVFQLYINNISDVADSFDLSYSKDNTFVAGTLPAGWSVSFHVDAGVADCTELGPIVSNTGVVAPSSSKLICAKVSIVDGIAFNASPTSIYFQAKSPLTGVSDIKHDSVYMAASQNLVLEPDHRAQIEPGGTQVYVHNLHNSGNTVFTGVGLVASDSLSSEGWTTKLYEDTDGDGVLTTADQPVGNYTLNPGETRIVFAKVFSPANAPLGASNLTSIVASGNTDTGGSSPIVVTASAQDTTLVSNSNMTIAKRQAPDANCDGDVDGGSSFSFDTFQAGPNTCVLYQLTATNQSSTLAKNVRISDSIPAFTNHFTDGGDLPAITAGSITAEPLEGDTGLVEGGGIDVISGDSVTLTFGVRVE